MGMHFASPFVRINLKLFHQLLVAPAALGLLAPMAANATELNFNGVSDYAATGEQVTSINQFSDVKPTDWAYQALSNLIERYGCVAGYPSSTYRGNRAMTRFEAAALLNACLDRVTEVTDELKRLMKEFESELAILKGRVDELEATQFSTTTKLKGQVDYFIGGVSYNDRDECDRTKCNTAKAGKCTDDNLSFSYRLTLNLNTSFTGKDLLYTRLRTGNMDNVWTQTDSYLADAKKGDNSLKVDKLWYTFPVGNEIQVTVGAAIENYYMVETPTRYKPVLKAFKLGGYGALMGASTGQGAGIQWRQDVAPGEAAFNIAANYVADGGDGAKSASTEGMFGSATDGYFLSQVGYGDRKWYVSGLYAHKQGAGGSNPAMGYSTTAAKNSDEALNVFGLRSYWSPENSGIVPTISGGLDFGSADADAAGFIEGTFGWMVGLTWDDAFVDGNKLGAAVGSYSSYATEVKGDSDPGDENFAAEIWYNFQVTDNISIIPAVFWSDDANGSATVDGANKFGALVQTTFKF